ncbi:MAG: FkbM family methyltransferase [Actinobacteria bacterium]|uniref:Unannotated protein n=1 Tax=freshwater metagenome TaxID=449393 RepID=A0A6J5YI71_9ZZZZ|nr:FkbM family methyltransferase [Actinomycetota bacterium]
MPNFKNRVEFRNTLVAMANGETTTNLIRCVYKALLRREADATGIEHWTRYISKHSAESFVAQLLKSEEYASLIYKDEVERSEIARIATLTSSMVKSKLTIVDIGSVDLPNTPHMWAELANHCPVHVIGFDPLDEPKDEVSYPDFGKFGLTRTTKNVALGDGHTHTLHVNSDASTSSFFELDVREPYEHLSTLTTVSSMQIPTSRMDDINLASPIDLLKMDIQGAELMVLEHALQTLKNVGTIYIEAGFTSYYKEQPLMPEIDIFLRSHGFRLVDIFPAHYPFIGITEVLTRDTLMWGDLYYIKETADEQVLASQALIAATLFNKANLAAYLLSHTSKR